MNKQVLTELFPGLHETYFGVDAAKRAALRSQEVKDFIAEAKGTKDETGKSVWTEMQINAAVEILEALGYSKSDANRAARKHHGGTKGL